MYRINRARIFFLNIYVYCIYNYMRKKEGLSYLSVRTAWCASALRFPPSPPHSLTIVPPQIPYNCRELRGGEMEGGKKGKNGLARFARLAKQEDLFRNLRS